jgi:polyhydroxyalkanoate synthesis repressor PhaR
MCRSGAAAQGQCPQAERGDEGMKESKGEAAGSAERIIKKYPNRRLYDTQTSSYITLAEIKQLVMNSTLFVVRDAKTGEDLTRSILLQIILEEEAGGSPMFSTSVLSNIIRFYGHALQGFMGGYLEKNIQTMQDLQTRMAEQSKGLTPEMWNQFMAMQAPMMQGLVAQNLEQSKNLYLQLQEQMRKQTEQMLESFRLQR